MSKHNAPTAKQKQVEVINKLSSRACPNPKVGACPHGYEAAKEGRNIQTCRKCWATYLKEWWPLNPKITPLDKPLNPKVKPQEQQKAAANVKTQKQKPVIICAFPGTGKTKAAKEHGWCDAECRYYQYRLSVTGRLEANPDWPMNYVRLLRQQEGLGDVVLASSHACVREALTEAGMEYYLAYPGHEVSKQTYIKRCYQPGWSRSFLEEMDEHWDDWLNSMRSDKGTYKQKHARHLILGQGEYLDTAALHIPGVVSRKKPKAEDPPLCPVCGEAISGDKCTKCSWTIKTFHGCRNCSAYPGPLHDREDHTVVGGKCSGCGWLDPVQWLEQGKDAEDPPLCPVCGRMMSTRSCVGCGWEKGAEDAPPLCPVCGSHPAGPFMGHCGCVLGEQSSQGPTVYGHKAGRLSSSKENTSNVPKTEDE